MRAMMRLLKNRGGGMALAALYTWQMIRNAWVGDDAYITFRALENFLHGYGPVFNVGERVQVFTHPLWFLVQAAINWALAFWTDNPFGNAQLFFVNVLLSIGLSVLTVVLLALWTARTGRAAVIALGLLILSKSFMDYSSSGLENPLTHLILLAFVTVFVRVEDFRKDGAARGETEGRVTAEQDAREQAARGYETTWTGRHVLPLALLAAVGGLDRLDTLLFYVPALLLLVWSSPQRGRALRLTAWGFLPLVAWELFSLFYYGAPFPNTAYAKINTGIPAMDLVRQGLFYYWNSLRLDPLTLVSIAVITLAALVKGNARTRAIAIGVLLYLLYTVKIGGDFMSGRYFSAPLLACCALVAGIAIPSRRSFALAAAAALLVGLAPLALVPERAPGFGAGSEGGHRVHDDGHGISDEQRVYAGTTLIAAMEGGPLPIHDAHDRWVYTAASPADVRLIGPLGMRGYVLGPDVHVIDLNSLADPLMPRLPLYETSHWRIGHFRHVVPDGYEETLSTGENRIADEGIAEYYEVLRFVTRGPLWDWKRLVEVWRLNTEAYDHLIG